MTYFDWPQFSPEQIDWPQNLSLPDEWSVWLHMRTSQDISPPNVGFVPAIVFNDPPIMQAWEYELDDYLDRLIPDPQISTNVLLESKDPVDYIARAIANTIIHSARLVVVPGYPDWRLELDTQWGYKSQVQVERLPWETLA